jgi:aryl-alcohol dehydrogenase-like predicted oxidoreductase
MQQTTLGDLKVAGIGLGLVSMTGAYTGAGTDEAESIRAIHRALDLGVTLLDTAEVYGPYLNEELLGKALRGRREQAVIATKFGMISHRNSGAAQVDSSPANIRAAIDGSLRRLDTDHIDLYYQHRVDPATPIEDTVGTLSELVEEGKIRAIGLSEAGPDTIRRAHAVHPIAAVQSEYSLFTRAPEARVLPLLRELGIGFVCYSPLGRGFLTGTIRSTADFDASDMRVNNPRFVGDNFQRNLAIVEQVQQIADGAGATAAQVALAWLLSRDGAIVPIPGTKRVARVEENSAADSLQLTPEQLQSLDDLPAPAGDSHDEEAMRLLER